MAFSLAAACGTASAGDVASLNILGFSDDGGIFAFEEYGVQDGSGFPYANRYYIDTNTDEFLPSLDVTRLVGFRLSRVDGKDGTPKIVHSDSSVPKSRACAYDYRLGGVQTFSADSLNAFAVMIAIESVGFEGPDFRWLAVTGRL